MKQKHPATRLWRTLTGADRKEADAASKAAYLAAHKANNRIEVCMTMNEALSASEFMKLIGGDPSKDPEEMWARRVDPALWGDVLLNKLHEPDRYGSDRYIATLRNFKKAGGVVLNLPDRLGARPGDYIFNDVYQNISRKDLSEFDRRSLIGKLDILVELGIKLIQARSMV